MNLANFVQNWYTYADTPDGLWLLAPNDPL